MIFGKRHPSAARAHETVEEMGRIIDALAGSRRPDVLLKDVALVNVFTRVSCLGISSTSNVGET